MNTLILGIILLIGVYICFLSFRSQENFETKILARAKVDPNLYLDNPIRHSLDQSLKDLDTISPFKRIETDKIAEITFRELGLNDNSVEKKNFQNKQEIQNELVRQMSAELNLMQNHPFVSNAKFSQIKSLRSLNNSQPLNLIPLENQKHLIAVNGKCLRSDPQARTEVVACNQNDPNQYFDLRMVTDQKDYKAQVDVLGSYYTSPENNTKYPFHMVKSVTGGNCLENDKSMISFKPCKMIKEQQWKGFTKHQKCLG